MVGVVAILLLAPAVLGVQAYLAINAARLPPTEPYDLKRPSQEAGALRVLWLGDSTVAGVGAASKGATVPWLVAEQSNETHDITVAAVSGHRIADVLDTQLEGLDIATFDRVYVSIGANDTTGATSRADFRFRYQALLDELRASGQVVLLGVPDMGSPTRIAQPLRSIVGWRGQQLDSEIKALAEDAGATHVDIAGATGPSFRDDPERYFAEDLFHPNDGGYRLWADAVVDSLTPQ